MKTLLVDDSELIRFRLVRQITDLPGIDQVLTASDGPQALYIAERVRPAVVVLELHLTDGDAVRLIPTLRQQHGLKVLVLTNDASDYNRQRCLQAGADAFFDKSTEFECLLERLRELAESASDRSLP